MKLCWKTLEHVFKSYQECSLFFRWVNKVDTSEELLLLIKTTTERYPELEKRVKAIHPYEVPELVAIPITDGFDEYLNWIETNSTPKK
jgi:periplasmic divalent cation tolerance protein